MSTKHFNYFDDYKNLILECPKCHWLGTFEQGSVEYYAELMDCHCPKCDVLSTPMLAIVSYPTLDEARANADKPGIREWVQQIDAGLDKFAREKLREPGQLPGIDEHSFTLVWDNDHSSPDDQRTLIKYGEVIIFSEPARSGRWVLRDCDYTSNRGFLGRTGTQFSDNNKQPGEPGERRTAWGKSRGWLRKSWPRPPN